MSLSIVQKRYLFHWFRLILMAEVAILLAGHSGWIVFLLAAAAFFTGFVLRAAGKYPGNPEPLLLDISSGLLGIVSTVIYYRLRETSFLFAVGILLPFLVVFPQFLYIITQKDLPARFRAGRLRR